MNISSAIVYSVPRLAARVRKALAALPGVEIHAETGDGRFIVTLEDVQHARGADTFVQLHQLEGVRYAAMVYQYGDDDTQQQEAQS